MSDLDALRERLMAAEKEMWRGTVREAYARGVDAALAALEQVGWCYSYPDGGTSVLYESEDHPKPDMVAAVADQDGWVSTLYRITPDTEGEGR